MNDFISDKLGRNELEEHPVILNQNLVEISREIASSLSNIKSTPLQLLEIVNILKNKQISQMISQDRVFKSIKTSKGQLQSRSLPEKIDETQNTETKLLYIEAYRTKHHVALGSFPDELNYPW